MSLSLLILSFSLIKHSFAASVVKTVNEDLHMHGFASVAPAVNEDLHIVNKVIAPDGFQRSTVLAGTTPASASFPGPLISGYKNKALKFNINVHDELTEQIMLTGTSIHWHGLFQHHTNWADGVSSVTQCPLTPGHNFNYDFSVPDQAGTYWYHSHYSVQYCDGLRGPLVIYDQNDPLKHLYDVDDETTIITLADWYHQFAQVLKTQPPPAVSDSTLINGKGRWPGNPTTELAVINVQHGKRYRFRLISMSCDPNYIFSIDNHRLTIIEADGQATQPFTVDSIQIYAAQRYSFVLEANQTIDNYWIRAQPDFANSTTFDNGINSAILRYQGAQNAEPPTRQITPGVSITDDTKLSPLMNPAAPGNPFPGGADKVLDLPLGFNLTDGRFLIKNATFLPPSVPVLLQILSGNHAAQKLLPKGSVYGLPLNKVIEINLQGGTAPGGPHPFHLHGHPFSVVQSAGAPYNYKNPVRRDTTIVKAGQTTTIRFKTDNPGPWFLHCHIDFHLEAGLAIVLAEDIPDIASANPTPQDWKLLCPLFDQSNTDNSTGSAMLLAASSVA